jgi:alanine racemase
MCLASILVYMILFKNIPFCSGGRILQCVEPEREVRYLLTDSRKTFAASASLFFAISGERWDGHSFIGELYQKGVRNFVVERGARIRIEELPQANIFESESSVKTLQQIAACHRKQFDYPVIGITGSNGKTIIKEWLSQLLATDYNIVKSPKSYNSQIGVPLSVWNMGEQHNLAIFEAGISRVREMKYLEQIIEPTIGIFTNIGTAHARGFESQLQKIEEKFTLFNESQAIVYCADHVKLHNYIQQHGKPGQQLVAWSEKDITIDIPFEDDASRENLGHCIALLRYLGIQDSIIQKKISSLKNIPMRLELKKGINNCALIDDTYNNDLAGLSTALDFMKQQHIAPSDSRTVILSDMLETGQNKTVLYKKIASLLEYNHVKRLIGIGEVISAHKDAFTHMQAEFYPDTKAFLDKLRYTDFSRELILVKGARVFQFESIVQRLQEKVHGTLMEINLDALAHNLNFYKSKLSPGTKIMVMVKAFSYGSGSAEVAALLQFHQVDYLAVAYADEGVTLRQHGISLPIMVLNPSSETFDTLLEYTLEPEIYSFRILKEFADFLARKEKQHRIHLKIDTGMRRLGFEPEHTDALLNELKEYPQLKVASIFSHLAGAEDPQHSDFSQRQIQKLKQTAELLEAALGYKVIKHILNSAGIIRYPEGHFDMVRLGIGLYGVEVNNLEQEGLQAVSTLKTSISQIKYIPAGETIGYGRRGVAKQDMQIATIAIGYADGFDRRFSNGKGQVLINGKRAPVIGNVCMDMTMVNITGIEAEEGDDVVVFGKDLPITELADNIGTIPYELLTGVGERVKRVFYVE